MDEVTTISTVERAGAEERLRKLAAIVEASDDAVIGKTIDGIITSWNGGAERIYGYTEAEMTGRPITVLIPDGREGEVPQILARLKDGQRVEHYETVRRRKDGRDVHVSVTISPIKAADGAVVGAATIARDISAHMRGEQELRRVNRALRMLSDVNQTLIRAPDETKLLHEVCRTVVETGGYRLAWVGFAEHDEEKTLRPVAHAGYDSGYIGAAKVSWGENDRGRGPGGTAIRTGRPCMARNILTDSTFIPWREAAVQHGYNSLIALPLICEGETLGALGIYSAEMDTFDDREIRILEELASDLAFGIAVQRSRVGHRRAQEDLREAEEKYRTVADFTYDWEYWLDPEGRLVYVSPSCERVTGYAAEEFQETPALLLSIVHPDDRAVMSLHLREMKEPRARPCDIDFRIVARGGDERWIAHTCQTVYSRDGTWIGRRASNRDITKRKRMEMALEESEAKTRSILENIEIGVALISPGMEILELNRKMRAWFPNVDITHGPLCYRAFNDPPRDAVCDYCPTHETLLDGLVHEATTATPQGSSVRNYRVVSSPIVDSAGRVTAAIEMVEDITEKLTLEAQLRQSQKLEAIGRLASGVAHDFNNKLAVISGYTELVLEQGDLAPALSEALQEIQQAAERSTDLTRQLLTFARRQTVCLKVLDLNEVVGAALKMAERLIGENISVSWFPQSRVWPVRMDPSQIDQILTNLCVNARDAISGVGEIVIRTRNSTIGAAANLEGCGREPGQYVMISVADNGRGMDKETLARAFEPFFTTKESGKGTGLGLATVDGIVRQNNGFIDVHSEPGRGTTFDIYLRRHVAKTVETEKTPSATPVSPGGETVLLVEDERAILIMARRVLEQLGYRVLIASTPREAIRIAEERGEELDLLITDVIMPEMNGLELERALVPLCGGGLRHLFMSGYSGDVIAHHGVLEEGVHFIQKPFSIRAFAAKVREALNAS
jgi:two-component system, cell cycle sensor histidine kinase and response regulator CckA